MAAAGLRLAAPSHGRSQTAAALALGVLVAIFLAAVFHPLESVGRSPRDFYAEVNRRVGNQRLATYGAMDFSANWMTGRTEVKMIRAREKAEDVARRSKGPLWLVAEASQLERLGLPAADEVVVRRDRILAPLLLLLRCQGGAGPLRGGGKGGREARQDFRAMTRPRATSAGRGRSGVLRPKRLMRLDWEPERFRKSPHWTTNADVFAQIKSLAELHGLWLLMLCAPSKPHAVAPLGFMTGYDAAVPDLMLPKKDSLSA